MKKLHKRAAIITGASQGLGAAIAEQFVKAGASVVLCARNKDKLQETKASLAAYLEKGQKIKTVVADVAKPKQVDKLINLAIQWFPELDILVNNAGVYGPLGALEDNDWDEWVKAININVMGTVYACRALIKHLKSRRYGKIINLSGGGATNPLPRITSYAASKAAVVRFTESLALELKDFHIDVNAIAPGVLATRLNEQLLAAGAETVGETFYARMKKLLADGGTSPEVGAQLAVYLASKESDGITGKLISAPWDPWENLHTHKQDLQDSDIYTLRRIIPKERGKSWGDK